MECKPFHANRYGAYYVYNGANKRYTHKPHDAMMPDAIVRGHYGAELQEQLGKHTAKLMKEYDEKQLKRLSKAGAKPLSPVETVE